MALVWIFVILCGFGVWLDAEKHGIKTADKVTWYQGGPIGWGLGTMLLWIVIFPTYMLARQRLIASAAMRDAEDSSPPLARAAPAAAVSVADELVKLADLRDRGALTEAEFEAHKAALRPPSPPTGF